MSNRGWDSMAGGEAMASTARQSGRTTGTSIAKTFVQGSKAAHPAGGDCDPMDSPSDLFPGGMDNLSVPTHNGR